MLSGILLIYNRSINEKSSQRIRAIKNYTNDRHTLLILSVDETVLAAPRTPDIRENIA